MWKLKETEMVPHFTRQPTPMCVFSDDYGDYDYYYDYVDDDDDDDDDYDNYDDPARPKYVGIKLKCPLHPLMYKQIFALSFMGVKVGLSV
jgi:hypothetical protein